MNVPRMRIFALLLCLAVLAAACGSDSDGTDTDDQETEATDGDGDGGGSAASEEFVIGSVDLPQAIDVDGPLASHIYSQEAMVQVWEPLVDFTFGEGPGGVAVPDFDSFEGRLAESWEVSDDGTTYTFKLREGVMSAYGNELTADDVVWTVERNLALGAFGAFFQRVGGVTEPSQVVALDDYTVEFRLQTPNRQFLATKASFFGGIADSTEAQQHATGDDPWASGWLAENAAGFGPYTVTAWEEGTQVVLEAREDYWDAPEDLIPRIVYRAMPSAATRFDLLRDGTIDYVRDTSAEQRRQLQEAEGVDVLAAEGSEQYMIFMRDEPPFDDVRVRQAIAFAVPYQEIVDTVYGSDPASLARRGASIIPDVYPGHTDEGWIFGDGDVDRARELLEEAGYPDGIVIEHPLTYAQVVAEADQEAVLIQTGLARAGIEVEVRGETPVRYEELEQAGEIVFALNQTGTPFLPDPAFAAALYWVCEAGTANAGWCDEEFDALVDEANAAGAEGDDERSLELYEEAQVLAMERVAAIPYVHPGRYYAISADVGGVRWYPDRHLRFGSLRWSE